MGGMTNGAYLVSPVLADFNHQQPGMFYNYSGHVGIEDCGEHCRSWEFLHSGLGSGFSFCTGVLHLFSRCCCALAKQKFIRVIYLGLLYKEYSTGQAHPGSQYYYPTHQPILYPMIPSHSPMTTPQLSTTIPATLSEKKRDLQVWLLFSPSPCWKFQKLNISPNQD